MANLNINDKLVPVETTSPLAALVALSALSAAASKRLRQLPQKNTER